MLLRAAAAWCTVLCVLSLATAGGFRAVEALYADFYTADDELPAAHWTIAATLPRELRHGPGREAIALAGTGRVSQSVRFGRDQWIAGFDICAFPPEDRGQRLRCRWSVFDVTGALPPRRMRRGVAELTAGHQFLRVHFTPLEIQGGSTCELRLCGPGEEHEGRLLLPVYDAPQPWGALRAQSSADGIPTERGHQCLRMRILQLPPQN